MRIGILKESFDQPLSDTRVSELVLKAVKALETLGCTVEEVSVPMHKHAPDIWAVSSTRTPLFLRSEILFRLYQESDVPPTVRQVRLMPHCRSLEDCQHTLLKWARIVVDGGIA
jgi:Asp-tRNA(Asn)/Glu-tRNA(Gln) amidotransferase A subunit family amidase